MNTVMQFVSNNALAFMAAGVLLLVAFVMTRGNRAGDRAGDRAGEAALAAAPPMPDYDRLVVGAMGDATVPAQKVVAFRPKRAPVAAPMKRVAAAKRKSTKKVAAKRRKR